MRLTPLTKTAILSVRKSCSDGLEKTTNYLSKNARNRISNQLMDELEQKEAENLCNHQTKRMAYTNKYTKQMEEEKRKTHFKLADIREAYNSGLTRMAQEELGTWSAYVTQVTKGRELTEEEQALVNDLLTSWTTYLQNPRNRRKHDGRNGYWR